MRLFNSLFLIYCFYLPLFFAIATSTQAEHNYKPQSITSSQKAELEKLLRPLLPKGYSFEILQNQTDPYRWRSTNNCSGITFHFNSNVPLSRSKSPSPPSVSVTIMPEIYDGGSLSLDVQPKNSSIELGTSKYLGKRQGLQVYACRDVGYPLPEEGSLTEGSLRRALGIIWDETRCITPASLTHIGKIVTEILPEGYTMETRRNLRDPYHWTSLGRSRGVTFYLRPKNKTIEKSKKLPTVNLTIMPSIYDGKPLPVYHVGAKKHDPDAQVEILPATYIGNWHAVNLYACVGWGHPLPKTGDLSKESLIKAFNDSVLNKNYQHSPIVSNLCPVVIIPALQI